MKKLFILGDSISIHYGEYLEKFVNGFFVYDRKGKGLPIDDINVHSQINGGDSKNVLEYLKEKPLNDTHIILLNCGLHDIKIDRKSLKYQVNKEDYKKNLSETIDILKKQKVKVIWISSTPVDDERHNNLAGVYRYDKDIYEYNSAAKKIMMENKVQIIDLYDFTKKLGNEIYVDHVHFTDRVRQLQAAFIYGHLI